MHSSPDRLGGPNTPSVLWNSMIRPLVNMTIFGALWYQGEANTRKDSVYTSAVSMLVYLLWQTATQQLIPATSLL